MNSMVTVVNNTILYIWQLLREESLKFSSQEKNWTDVCWWMFTKLTAGIILQYI